MDVLSKIKKLLALGRSPNVNEAAAALKRAQELMEQYGIDQTSVGEAEVVEEEIGRHGGARPPFFETYLIVTIAQAFGCRTLHRRNGLEKNQWVFIGLPHRTEVASYLGVVLLRKLYATRREYVKALYRCKRDTKVRRADEYCMGWCSTVVQKIHAFVGSADGEAVLDEYMKRYEGLGPVDPIKRKSIDRYEGADYYQGGRAARDIELQHGVHAGLRQTLLEVD